MGATRGPLACAREQLEARARCARYVKSLFNEPSIYSMPVAEICTIFPAWQPCWFFRCGFRCSVAALPAAGLVLAHLFLCLHVPAAAGAAPRPRNGTASAGTGHNAALLRSHCMAAWLVAPLRSAPLLRLPFRGCLRPLRPRLALAVPPGTPSRGRARLGQQKLACAVLPRAPINRITCARILRALRVTAGP
mgnify:CR=1 FL=1